MVCDNHLSLNVMHSVSNCQSRNFNCRVFNRNEAAIFERNDLFSNSGATYRTNSWQPSFVLKETGESIQTIWPFQHEISDGWVMWCLFSVKLCAVWHDPLHCFSEDRVERCPALGKSRVDMMSTYVHADDQFQTLERVICKCSWC